MLTEPDLLAAGWPADADFTLLLAEVAELEARGVHDPKYALKLLERKFPKPDRRAAMREESLPFAEAIEAVTPADTKNLGAVRRFMRDLMRCPVVEAGAIMPDACPAGKSEASIPVGGVVAARNAILPSAHGSDICCSLYATFFQSSASVTQLMDDLVESTRFGPGGRPPGERVRHPVNHESVWTNRFLTGLREYAEAHMADQGDGNHFAYLGKVSLPEEALNRLESSGYRELAIALRAELGQTLVLATHHGSRGLGAQLFARGQQAALKQTAKLGREIPDAAAWLDADSDDGRAYWEALQYVGRWTRANHESIHQRFLDRSLSRRVSAFGNEHNFVWKRGDLYLHGKGATPAWKDESGRPLLGLIPLNMASPILMVLGRDNAEYLSFAPHGAGRNLSRRALLKQFKEKGGGFDVTAMLKSLERSIEGIEARWYLGWADYAECPPAYKPAAQVREQIERFALAEVVAEIQPLGSIMAGHPPGRDEEVLTPKQKRQIQHRAERRKDRQNLRSGRWDEDGE